MSGPVSKIFLMFFLAENFISMISDRNTKEGEIWISRCSGHGKWVKSGQVSAKELVGMPSQGLNASIPVFRRWWTSNMKKPWQERLLVLLRIRFWWSADSVKGFGPASGGSLVHSRLQLFANYRPNQTDAFVQRLEDLGFIILGRTNTPEFGFKISQTAASMAQ